jgi:glucan 1,3-beta-glucosidase
MQEMGLNSFRLPVGYWNVLQDPYDFFSPSDVHTSLRYIDWAFNMAEKYGLTVLLNLHGAAGSQNGIDHSGCAMTPAFLNATLMDPMLRADANIKLTLDAIEAMAQRYGSHPNLEGFALLNEPNSDYSHWNHEQMLAFYESGYDRVRKFSNANVVFNELYEDCWAKWAKDLQEPRFYNVVLDVHLYNWQAPVKEQESAAAHMRDAKEWGVWIEELVKQHPVVVGEWCMSTGTIRQVGQPFVDEEVNSFRSSTGWYMWNWKVERDIGFDTWDVKYQYQIKGLNPLRIYQKK